MTSRLALVAAFALANPALAEAPATSSESPAEAADSEGEGDQELALDLGADREEGETLSTVGLLYAWEFMPANRLIASGAITQAEGHLVHGGDVALGLYHAWDVRGFEPELGVEFGTALGETEAHPGFVHPFARFGAGLFHTLGKHLFAGLAADAALRTDRETMVRALFEVGVTL